MRFIHMIAFIILRQITAGIKLVTEQKMLPNRFCMQNALFICRGLLSHSVLFSYHISYSMRKLKAKKDRNVSRYLSRNKKLIF